MADRKINNIVIEDAKLIFKNFAGKEGAYNPAGKRNFCVILDDDLAHTLLEDGWNIKTLRPRDVDDTPTPYIPVTVSYEYNPPKIWVVTGKGKKNLLDEEDIGLIDWAEIENVDLIIRPYQWEVNGKTGVKAYLKSMYVTLVEDDLDAKYRDFVDEDPLLIPAGAKEEIPFC